MKDQNERYMQNLCEDFYNQRQQERNEGSFGSIPVGTVESRKSFQTQTGETPQQIGHEAQNPDALRISGNMNTCSVVPPGKMFENYSRSRGSFPKYFDMLLHSWSAFRHFW